MSRFNSFREAHNVIGQIVVALLGLVALGLIGWCVVGVIALFLYILEYSDPILFVFIIFGVALLGGIIYTIIKIIEYCKTHKE